MQQGRSVAYFLRNKVQKKTGNFALELRARIAMVKLQSQKENEGLFTQLETLNKNL